MSAPFADMVDRYAAAIRAGDAHAILAMSADDIVSYDALPPLENVGHAVVADRLGEWMALYASAIGCETRFGGGMADGDVGHCWFLERITGTSKKGDAIDMWLRITWCLARRDGEWRIVHEHQSEPFDPETGKARLDLKP